MEKMEEKGKASRMKTCADCGELNIHQGRGLCGSCYNSRRRAGTLPSKLSAGSDQQSEQVKTPAPACVPRTGRPEEIISTQNPNINLVFPSCDKPLYDAILAEAKYNRRDPDQQILWIIQRSLSSGGSV